MKISKAAVAVAVSVVVPASATGQASGPKATYWVSVQTESGMAAAGYGAMMQGAMGSQPGYPPGYTPPSVGGAVGSAAGSTVGGMVGGYAGSVIGGALGGLLGGRRARPPQQQPQQRAQAPAAPAQPAKFVRSLSLALGSTQKPAGDPSAQHLPPPGLRGGAPLPLLTPQANPSHPSFTPRGPADGAMQRPRGKMLIYWGCGERAAAAPITVDFAAIAPGRMPNIPTIQVDTGGGPPSSATHATVGVWPNSLTDASIPASESLVGQHTVRGNYSPEIRFALDQAHDFMAPLILTGSGPTPGGGRRLAWTAIPGATGYFAQVVGSQGETMVMWSSSGAPAAFGQMLEYVPPAEVRRLIGSRVVMPPTQTECIVPPEVVRAAPQAMLMMIAYGDEVNVSDPPKPARGPWHVNWTAKVRFKSTHTGMLGVPGME